MGPGVRRDDPVGDDAYHDCNLRTLEKLQALLEAPEARAV
jgi:hypothetical protein